MVLSHNDLLFISEDKALGDYAYSNDILLQMGGGELVRATVVQKSEKLGLSLWDISSQKKTLDLANVPVKNVIDALKNDKNTPLIKELKRSCLEKQAGGATETMGMALGIIETRGLAPAIEAADAMTKAAEVRLIGREFVGGGYVTVLVRGETGAVNEAVRAGADACERVGDGLVAAHIIARPHREVEPALGNGEFIG